MHLNLSPHNWSPENPVSLQLPIRNVLLLELTLSLIMCDGDLVIGWFLKDSGSGDMQRAVIKRKVNIKDNPERKTPIQYTNTYIWNLERW